MCRQFNAIDMGVATNVDLPPLEPGMSEAFDSPDVEDLIAAARKHRNDLWESGGEFDLRTPTYTRVLESLGERFGSEM